MDEDSVGVDRGQIRKQMLAWRAELGPGQIAVAGAAITRRALALPVVEPARVVAVYLSIAGEVPTSGIVDWIRAGGRQMVAPRVEKGAREMTLHEVADPARDLEAGVFGIPTPRDSCPEVDPTEVDLAFVPGLAFDERCNRIGFGAGHYDRCLGSAPRLLKVGVFFAGQRVPSCGPEEWDVPLDYVVTEEQVFRR